MLVLITYDVSTTDKAGARRLTKIAKVCVDYGQRVQNSVFECILEPAALVKLKTKIESLMDPKCDSIRYYYLGSNWQNKIEHIGAKQSYNPEGTIII